MIVIKTRQPDPELEQKIRMLLEREHIEAEQISIGSQEKLVFPGLTLDGMTHEVSCNGRKTSLTRLEFDLLLILASHEEQVFSKEKLFRAVWGQNCDDTLKVVANTVSNLRKKLAGCGSFIRTTHGGYAFVSQKENDPACWVSVKQFSKNDTATACQDWLRSTRLGRGSIKSHVRTVKVLGMGLFAFQERIHLWKGVTH